MNFDNIKDYRLQKYLRKAIMNQKNSNHRFILRTLYHCGERAGSDITGVAVAANKRHSRIIGAKMCKNSWACPVCSAIQMSKKAAQISAAIDALKDTHNAIMITFTVFHSKNDTCQQIFDLLYKTWAKVTYVSRNTDGKLSRFGKFLKDLDIKHRVRCGEATYTPNGWHPHFHCLFWVPKKNFDKVLKYEESLREAWREAQEKVMGQIYGYAKYNAFYESERLHGEAAAGVYISKADGKPTIQKSSDYLCGWGADKELTGNYQKQATNPDSLTMYQLLEKASNGDKQAEELYLEFARYIIEFKHRRADISRTGLKEIIQNYINSNGYKEVMKKKRMQYAEDAGAWQLVAWFSKEDWYKIYNSDIDAVAEILALARLPDGYNLICKFLAENNIDCHPLPYDPIGYCEEMTKLFSQAA